jgi:hypothetical protein
MNALRIEDKFWLIILVLIAGGLRLLPEIIAYPYPIGYDVINYYLPVLTNFDNHWDTVSSQYPFYILTLYLMTNVTKLPPHFITSSSAVLLYILFSISIYQISRRLFNLSQSKSLFSTLFVIFQLTLLRTSWDLQKDMLSLTVMLFAISLLSMKFRSTYVTFFLVLILCIVSVLTDRMIGLLLVGTLLIYVTLMRKRMLIVLAIVTFTFFIVSVLQNPTQIGHALLAYPKITSTNHQLPVNLLVLFLVTTGLLLPFGIFGFLQSQSIILKIPVLISVIGSLSWLLHPLGFLFLPERWIFIFGILISIFASYGINVLIMKLPDREERMQTLYMFFFLVPFAILGVLFATSSSEVPISLPAAFHDYIGKYGPTTMQANSISIPESKAITDAISWINSNTPRESNLVIDKHWRGWVELLLQHRSFTFYENIADLEKLHKNYYLLISDDSRPLFGNKITTAHWIYENVEFVVYEVDSNKKHNDPAKAIALIS